LPQLQVTTNRDDVQQGTGSALKLESYKTNVELDINDCNICSSVYGFAADVIVVIVIVVYFRPSVYLC
jgi:uncharacterized protein HemY